LSILDELPERREDGIFMRTVRDVRLTVAEKWTVR
jgi:hypothetical protein